MSDKSLDDGCEPCALRAMAHLFWCPDCPAVAKASEVHLVVDAGETFDKVYTTTTGRRVRVLDRKQDRSRDAVAAVAADGREFCQAGFELLQEAFARGWGS